MNHLHKPRDRTERTELTVLCLLQQDGRVLLQNRIKADWQGYALPGGHVEPGESIYEAVIREMREETGLTVLRPTLAGVKQFPIEGGRYLVFLFSAEDYSGTLTSSEEGEMEWIELDRLESYPTVADLRTLIDVIRDPAKCEFQYLVNGDEWSVSVH